jgi:hypothetical protein
MLPWCSNRNKADDADSEEPGGLHGEDEKASWETVWTVSTK